jgi:PhnB protein
VIKVAQSFSLFISFNGECREAVKFYAKVFKSEVLDLMTYSQMPPDPNYTVPEEDKEKIMFCRIPIFGRCVMFGDFTTEMPFYKGNNFCPTLGTDNMEEIRRLFGELKEAGKVEMELQKTFWSDLFGMVTDKYGITWQLSHDSGSSEQ